MKVKRILALSVSAAMLMGMSLTTLAASTSATGSANETGTGTNEGLTNKEVYSVDLPTVVANQYDYFLDPDNNIADTAASRYSGYTPTNTTNAYFKTTASTMTSQSASSTIKNESYQDIDVTMTVSVSGASLIGIEEVTSAATASSITATTPTMFMGLESKVTSEADKTGVTGAAFASSDGSLTQTFTLASDAADYTKVWNVNKYEMSHTGSAKDPGQLEFNLVVGCNSSSDADWSSAASEQPSVVITYSYAKHASTPTSYVTESTISDTANTLTLTLPDGVTLSSATLVKVDGSQVVMTSGTHYSVSGTTFTVTKTSILTNNVGGTIQLDFSDGHTDTVTID